ncbi:neural proliferation differentiation and control protein 1a [Synchiropus splendidus]|uniref:neural proliferation differentiation and control protein 1a n=1 Tax=Synchiropus splendidus TaxID=270530 RepID=UPI00237E5D8C|nr:neural proliferation differentiation and control protein 1a [Synchiropus splendidus]XP_053715311.1 neural proliferation differentiation and control protein 1a [Synchiropus splendidus]
MLLLSSPRSGHPRRASMLLLAAVLLFAVPAIASLPAASKCPYLDCVKVGRQTCQTGSSHCGPCISVMEEDQQGRCVIKRRHRQHGKTHIYPDVDQEIDYIHSYIEKQEISSKLSKHPAVDDRKTKTEAREKSASHPSSESQNATTPDPDDAAAVLTNTPAPQPRVTGDGRAGPIVAPSARKDHVVVSLISLCVGVGALAVVLATVCYVKMQKKSHLTQKVDYPAYSRTGGPALVNGASMGDKTLAQNAQMYHYQHQKQLMLSLGNHKPEQKVLDTEVTSDEEEVGGDFTVYECPGLAPTGEMEVKNPLFDDSTLHYQGNQK